MSSVIAAPDRRSRFRLDLAGQTEPREFGADFAESRTLDRCRRRQATVLALCPSAHHRKLYFGKFDTHDPTLPLILEVRAIRAPHQDEPRIGQGRRGGWVTRALRTASDDDTNASFRTKSQSFLRRARNCSEWSDKLLRVARRQNSTTASARRSALRFKLDQTQPSIAHRYAFRSREQVPHRFHRGI